MSLRCDYATIVNVFFLGPLLLTADGEEFTRDAMICRRYDLALAIHKESGVLGRGWLVYSQLDRNLDITVSQNNVSDMNSFSFF